MCGAVFHVGGDPMATRATTQTLADLDTKLTTLRAQLHDNTWEPATNAAVRVEIDQLLEQRQAISNGTVRGGHRG